MKQHCPIGSTSRAAFTLVELLVVIGIIAVLISLLLPSLNKARQSANRVACLSNIRQVGIGIAIYTAEAKGYLPNGMTSTSSTPVDEQYRRWYGPRSMGKYFGVTEANFGTFTPKVLQCPSDTGFRRPFVGQGNYTMNIDVMGGDAGFGTASQRYRPGRTANRVHYRTTFWRKPIQKIVLIDGKPDAGGNVYAAHWYFLWEHQSAPPAADFNGRADFRHTNGMNVLFLDGHAEWFRKPSGFGDYRYIWDPRGADVLTGHFFQGEYNNAFIATYIGKRVDD